MVAAPSSALPAVNRPGADPPAATRPKTDRPAATRPEADPPAANRPATDQPAATRPATGHPSTGLAAIAMSPVTGAWRPGDDVGNRRFADLGEVAFERGGAIPVRVAYETWGTLSPASDNAVLVEHALTGDSHVVGAAGPGHATPGWWDGIIGPGAAIDTDRWFVVAANVLGGCQGTTGPSSIAEDGRPYGSRFPFVTTRDQVAVEALLADRLAIDAWALVIGGSMGGMRALEWAVSRPARVQRLFVLASGAYATGDQIGWCAPQLAAIRADPGFRGGDYYDAPDGVGPHVGLGIARRIAHATYRSSTEINTRFGRRAQQAENPLGGGGRYAVESYLEHQADKLIGRFDANSYVVLTEAMNSHDVGRGRGGIEAALAEVSAETLVAGIDSDRLYPVSLSREVADGVTRAHPVAIVTSPYGHDGFLLEVEQVRALVADLLTSDDMG